MTVIRSKGMPHYSALVPNSFDAKKNQRKIWSIYLVHRRRREYACFSLFASLYCVHQQIENKTYAHIHLIGCVWVYVCKLRYRFTCVEECFSLYRLFKKKIYHFCRCCYWLQVSWLLLLLFSFWWMERNTNTHIHTYCVHSNFLCGYWMLLCRNFCQPFLESIEMYIKIKGKISVNFVSRVINSNEWHIPPALADVYRQPRWAIGCVPPYSRMQPESIWLLCVTAPPDKARPLQLKRLKKKKTTTTNVDQ